MRRNFSVGFFLVCVMSCAGMARAQRRFAPIEKIVNQAITEHRIPGAVVIVGHNGRVVYRRAFGMRSLVPVQEKMTVNTIFDMASLTKPLMTATAVMQLCQEGKIRVDDPVAKYIPEFAANGKSHITIRDLLTHYSGLPPDLSLAEPWVGKGEAYRLAFAIAPLRPPGVRFQYSDINFIVLGALVEKMSPASRRTCTICAISFDPLRLKHTRYLPPVSWRPLIAPTPMGARVIRSRRHVKWTGPDVMLRGLVHDPTSRRMGGVAGHAGLFSCGDDVAVFAQNMLNRLAGRPSRFPLSRIQLQKMVAPEQPATGTALRGIRVGH